MKILVAEKIHEQGLEILKQHYQTDIKTGLSAEEVEAIIPEYDALIVRSATKANAALIEKGVNLKVIGRAGNGVDNIDLDAASQKGVIVVNTPDSNTVAAGEHAVALMMALARNIPQADASLHAGKWERSKFGGVELLHKTVVVIGLGPIGSLVAARLKAFDMRVVAYDPYVSDARFENLGIERVATVDEAMQMADYITLHVPKTPDTTGMIGEAQFALAKKNLRLVNAARGGLVDEKALYNALKEGRIAGAATDTFVAEPKEGAAIAGFESELLSLPNFIATPHLGASTAEAQVNVGVAVAEQVVKALDGDVVSAVNLPGLKVKDMAKLAPMLRMVGQMGRMYQQYVKQAPSQVDITYAGEFDRGEARILTLSFMAGLLSGITEGAVNLVNVEKIANDRGMAAKDSFTASKDGYNVIHITLATPQGLFVMAGRITASGQARILEFDGYETSFEPTEHTLLMQNQDQPGVIGKVGTVLGAHGVNISVMKVGKKQGSDVALMVCNMDSDVDDATIKELGAVAGITKAVMIHL